MQGGGRLARPVRAGPAAVFAPRQLARPDLTAVRARRPDRPPRASALIRFPATAAGNSESMVGILIAAVLAALTFAVCSALGLPVVMGIVFAVVVLAASVPALGNRFGLRNF